MTQINMCAKTLTRLLLFFSLLSIKCLALWLLYKFHAPHGKNNLLKGYYNQYYTNDDRKNSSDEFDDDILVQCYFHHGL